MCVLHQNPLINIEIYRALDGEYFCTFQLRALDICVNKFKYEIFEKLKNGSSTNVIDFVQIRLMHGEKIIDDDQDLSEILRIDLTEYSLVMVIEQVC